MLRPAVLLDAAMTVFEARLRLAQHGFWLDPADDAVQQVLRESIEQVREARELVAGILPLSPARVSGVAGDAPGMPETSLTASDQLELPDVDATLAELRRPIREGRVAVRREEAMTVFWYAFPVEQVLEMMRSYPSHAPLLHALNLHEWGSRPTKQVGEVSASKAVARDFDGVVLRGTEFVAVAEPRFPPKMAAPDMPVSGPLTRGGDSRPAPAPAPAMPVPVPVPVPPMAATPMPSGSAPPSAPTTRAPVEVKAYPKVEHPEAVTVGVAFDLNIGLGAKVMTGQIDTGPMVLTAPAGSTTIAVDIQVVADGFDSPTGWRHVLTVAVDDPYRATLVVPLVPAPQDVPVKARAITVHYAYDGVTRGSITRYLAVLASGAVLPTPDPRGINLLGAQPATPSITMTPSTAVPDIEVNIAKADGNGARGKFLVTMRNAHGVPVPDQAPEIDLGDDPSTFAKKIIDSMPAYDGKDGLLGLQVGSHSKRIASKLPPTFWQMLREVHAKVGNARPLTLQLNSADPYVPWELAAVNPPLDPSRVSILAAQVTMGRWILGDAEVPATPRASLPVHSFAVMAGMYKSAESGLKKLPNAEAEVADLDANYKSRGVIKYDCTVPALASLLTASVGGGAQLVHFAGHGQVDPTRPGDAALYLSDGTPLDASLFRDTPLGQKNAPFMFLNACMVGTAGTMLGDYDGFPGNCLAGNFTGLVAPIWAVNDVIAKWIATEFYREALAASPRPVAEILRDLRQQFATHTNASSYLAYVYYGNPYLTFS